MDKTNFELLEDKAEDLGIGEHKWYGKEDQTEKKSIHDKGSGEPVVIRLFEWKLSPTLERLPTKEEILTPEYLRHMQNELWGDALRLVMEPRVVIDKESIKIFAPCQARTGQSFLEDPKLLQEWLN